ncbi:unnamed protein product [Musa acuminata subsp. malaccensis]|uniref:(wild Malaysian banana) hypothetical protein n=1 Tax=Musa acuminata subsp. malaccensis TaxID=214687 RepID=A0A804J8V4_MUSAM|nr:PREDICTED: fasciclin-like arabinogalactan protein 14 [Musa acuminata subsp. malaccensis]CAG1839796.1 unnamed protein product [Musa acuminata subsp. malaccensis]
MAPKAHGFLVFLPYLLLISSSAVAALDIVGILQPFDEFSTFTKYLTQTKVADEINRRQTITVLAVDNSAISALSSLSADTLKNVISVHVILDYYDPYKLDKVPKKTALLTTLFQASGLAANNMGFLNYTELPGEQMMFGSAAPGAPLNSNLQKVVAARPYNVSVLQVSTAIMPPGIASAPAQAPATAPGKKTSPSAPAAAPKSSPAAPESSPASPIEAPAGSAAAPAAHSKNADAESPAESADAPVGSDSARAVVSATIGIAMGAVAWATL